MPVSAEIFSVDTVRIGRAEEAFRSGVLCMPTEAAGDIARTAGDWSDSPLNSILLVLVTILTIIFISRIVNILPYLIGGIFRWKAIVNLEDSMRLTRDRNAIAAIMGIAFCLVASKYEIYAPAFAQEWSHGMKTLLTAGALLATASVREVLINALSLRRISRERYRIAGRAAYNFFIVISMLMVTTAGICPILGLGFMSVKIILIVEMCFLYLVFLLRKSQILSKACNQFMAISYLCALEILPVGMIAVSALLL